jgi:hypothetical protein
MSSLNKNHLAGLKVDHDVDEFVEGNVENMKY